MRFDVLTLFPEMVDTILRTSILGRAMDAQIFSAYTHQIRDYSQDKHHRVDDTPYGGGKGMLLRPEPIDACYHAVLKQSPECKKRHTIYLSPQGKILTQQKAKSLLEYDQLILLCGHYEGVDQRILDEIVEEEISVGDYILTGGELPACILIDCVARLIEGVLADSACHEIESISCGMLEYPQYTHPAEFHGKAVPQVLLNGNHAEIAAWRFAQALEKTKRQRPDLL